MHVSFSLYWMIVSKVHPGFVTVMKLSSVSGLLAIMINDQIGASVLKANTFFFPSYNFMQVSIFDENMKEQSRTLDSHLKTLQVILT